jgi:EmrB/QacA subfamily drug resistance transporter
MMMEQTETLSRGEWLRKWGSLVVMSLALAIIIIDTTLLNVSLGTLVTELHTTIKNLEWVITIYALLLAALTITGGRLGDIFGRKKMFMLGAIIFAVGSFIASISTNIGTMIAGESVIEAIGAALMMPATAALLVSNFKGRERAIAFGVWGSVAGAASAIGPLLGGYLTTNYSWRWGFRINIVVVAVLLLGTLLIRESRDEEHKPTLDFGGVALSSLGLLAVVFGIIESSTYGWGLEKLPFMIGNTTIPLFGLSVVPVVIAIGLAFLAAFVYWERIVERRGQTPLVSLSLFRNVQFTAGMLTTTMLSLAMSGIVFALPVFFQSVRSLTAFDTGVALLPISVLLLVFGPVTGFVSRYIAPKYLIQLGLLIDVIALFVLRSEMSVTAVARDFIVGMSLYGAGMGLILSAVNNVTLSAVPVSQAGEASGVSNTFRQVGASLGVAIVGAVFLTVLSTSFVRHVEVNYQVPAPLRQQLVKTIQGGDANIEFGLSRLLPAQLPDTVKQAVKSSVDISVVDAVKTAYLYIIWFVLLGLAVSVFLPSARVVERAPDADHIAFPPRREWVIAAVIVIISTGAMAWFIARDVAARDSVAPVIVSPRGDAVLPSVSPTFVTPVLTPQAQSGEVLGVTTDMFAYANKTMGFGLTLPHGFTVTPLQNGAVIQFAKNTSESVFQMQRYATDITDMSVLLKRIQQSPGVTEAALVPVGNRMAVRYVSTASPGHGLAFLSGKMLYYSIGTFDDNWFAQSFIIY